MPSLRQLLLTAWAFTTIGCFRSRINGSDVQTTGGRTGSSTGGSSGAASAAGSSASGGTTSAGTSGTGGAAASTGGSAGSSSGALPPIVDGGYVFCTMPDAADAGPTGDGGMAFWLCAPGTYLCDLGGEIGNCFQCLSDADCANQSRPTYDPRRPRCDLTSGIPGYQNFCQECLSDADCRASPSGPLCDRNPGYPPNTSYSPGGSEQPSLAGVGFETCGPFATDCRMDGGPICLEPGQLCEPDSGACAFRVGYCAVVGDCGPGANGCFNGRCVDCGGSGGTCPLSCLGDFGPGCPETGPDGGAVPCGPRLRVCSCESDADCAGLWPRCELDAGLSLPGRNLFGLCGCDEDSECGDAGLICLPYSTQDGDSHTSMCGPQCNSPASAACSSVFPPESPHPRPVCNVGSGICEVCTSDQQCRSLPGAGGPVCTPSGGCGCMHDSDCRTGESCLYNPAAERDICMPQPRHCTPDSCSQTNGFFCDWDSGACLYTGVGFCLDDFDCTVLSDTGYAAKPFCNQALHTCQACTADNDCNISSSQGGLCFPDFSGEPVCGCRADAGCSGMSAGPICNGGACGCSVPDDCPAGQSCASVLRTCGFLCNYDSDCQSGYLCSPRGTCRARCDDGGACPAAQPNCDTADSNSEAGKSRTGPVPDALWCYPDCEPGFPACAGLTPCDDAGSCPAGLLCDRSFYNAVCVQCTSPIDCPGDQGCNSSTKTCGSCAAYESSYPDATSDCPPGDLCSNVWTYFNSSGACLPACDVRSCPADRPICARLPELTPDHSYCFGCLRDADCADAGPGAYCDTSVSLTFTCKVP